MTKEREGEEREAKKQVGMICILGLIHWFFALAQNYDYSFAKKMKICLLLVLGPVVVCQLQEDQ